MFYKTIRCKPRNVGGKFLGFRVCSPPAFGRRRTLDLAAEAFFQPRIRSPFEGCNATGSARSEVPAFGVEGCKARYLSL